MLRGTSRSKERIRCRSYAGSRPIDSGLANRRAGAAARRGGELEPDEIRTEGGGGKRSDRWAEGTDSSVGIVGGTGMLGRDIADALRGGQVVSTRALVGLEQRWSQADAFDKQPDVNVTTSNQKVCRRLRRHPAGSSYCISGEHRDGCAERARHVLHDGCLGPQLGGFYHRGKADQSRHEQSCGPRGSGLLAVVRLPEKTSLAIARQRPPS